MDVESLRDATSAVRRRACCPTCGERVVPKLGPVLIAHAAHLPDSRCPARTGEGALHLNTKFAIARALEQGGARALLIELPCEMSLPAFETPTELSYPGRARVQQCPRVRRHVLVDAWDEVRLEHPVGDLRADIALLLNGRVTCAIEVRVRHAVEDDKVAAYATLETPWIELDAELPPWLGGDPWNPAVPLRIVRFGPWRDGAPPARFVCEVHQGMFVREGPQGDAGPFAREHPVAARIVDLYRAGSDGRTRRLGVLDAIVSDGRAVAVQARAADAIDHADIERVAVDPPAPWHGLGRAWHELLDENTSLARASREAWARLESRWRTERARIDLSAWSRASPLLDAAADPRAEEWWPARRECAGGPWRVSPEFRRGAWDLARRDADPRGIARAERLRARDSGTDAWQQAEALLGTARALIPDVGLPPRLLSCGRAWTWTVAGGESGTPQRGFAAIIAFAGLGRLAGRLAEWPRLAAMVEKRDAAAWIRVAAEVRSTGLAPVFVAWHPRDRGEARWSQPTLPVLLVSPNADRNGAPSVRRVRGGAADLPSVARGLARGALTWEPAGCCWTWRTPRTTGVSPSRLGDRAAPVTHPRRRR